MINRVPFFWIFIAGTVFSFVLTQFLEYVDYVSRKKSGTKVPKELFGYVDSKVLKKTCDYENEKYFCFLPESIVLFVLTLVLVLSGFYPFLLKLIQVYVQNIYLTVMFFYFFATLPESIVVTAFDLYKEFSIEKKYEFSNMTIGMWIADEIKEFIVSLIIAVPLIFAAVFLLLHMENFWWLLLAVIYISFSLGISFLYPVLIAPMFNKFTPVESLELKKRLETLLQKTGFESKGIFVMDASKRSKHSNAYFTGFGKNKRVVLYDTLLKQLSIDETESVLAHELGHYKLRHIVRRMFTVLPAVVVVLFLMSVLVKMPALYTDFGFSPETSIVISESGVSCEYTMPYIRFAGIFLLPIVFGGFMPLVSLISNAVSRRDEFQADAFSANLCERSRSLVTALIKLNRENLKEVLPPKIYSVFNYNHPPLLERIRALDEISGSLRKTDLSDKVE